MPRVRSKPPETAVTTASTAPVESERARRARSRTQELPSLAVAQTSPRTTRGSRETRQASVASDGGLNNPVSNSRLRGQGPQETADVDMSVIEERSDDDEDIDTSVPAPAEGYSHVPAGDLDDFAGADHSFQASISGTTARSEDYSQEEPVDAHAIFACGAETYDAAVALLYQFDQHAPRLKQIVNGIDKADSPARKLFDKNVSLFKSSLGRLGKTFNGALVDPVRVLSELFQGSDLSETSSSWGLLELFQIINLAHWASSVADPSTDVHTLVDALLSIDERFPRPFLRNITMPNGVSAIGDTSYMDETFEIAMRLRLQAIAMRIHQQIDSQSFDLNDEIENAFFNRVGDEDGLRTWDVNGLGGGNLGLLPEYASKLTKKIRVFQSVADDDIQELAVLFPWNDFRLKFLQWARLRMEEIVASMDRTGGARSLLAATKNELQLLYPYFTIDPAISTQSSPAKPNSAATRPRSHEAPPSTIAMPLRSTARTVHQHDSATIHEDVERGDDVQMEVDAYTAKWENNQNQAKENIRGRALPKTSTEPSLRYVDAQDDAVQIAHFETQVADGHAHPVASRQAAGPSNTQKRALPSHDVHPIDDAVSEDEGFQNDTRSIDMSQRRNDAIRPVQSASAPNPHKRVRVEAAGDTDDQLPPSTLNARLEQLNRVETVQLAKEISQATRLYRPRQARVGWSDEETDRLMEFIAKYGVSWSYLKQRDEQSEVSLFGSRDQVALKDKARNLKTTLILGDRKPLPPNFDKVALDNKAIQRIIRQGKGHRLDDEDVTPGGLAIR